MAKLTKDSLFKDVPTRPETNLEKTTRIVREITEGEAEKRQIKMARLRTARLEREANTPAKPAAKARKKAASGS